MTIDHLSLSLGIFIGFLVPFILVQIVYWIFKRLGEEQEEGLKKQHEARSEVSNDRE